MFKEFKAFALRGNVLDLAVGLLLGAAFGGVVQSLANDVMMNLVAAIVGQPDFTDLTLRVGDGIIRYGSFLTALVHFILVAFAMFLFVKAINRAFRPKGADAEPPTMRQCPHCMTPIPVKATACSACTRDVEPVAA